MSFRGCTGGARQVEDRGLHPPAKIIESHCPLKLGPQRLCIYPGQEESKIKPDLCQHSRELRGKLADLAEMARGGFPGGGGFSQSPTTPLPSGTAVVQTRGLQTLSFKSKVVSDWSSQTSGLSQYPIEASVNSSFFPFFPK